MCEDPLTGVWGPVTGRDPRVEAAGLARLADPYLQAAHEQAERDRAAAQAEAERRAGLDDRVLAAAKRAVADYEAEAAHGPGAPEPEPEPPAAAAGDAPPLRRRAPATTGRGAQS